MVTATVAVAVGVIAYRQWRVAREKLILDLFERRFRWYFEYKGQLLEPLDNTRDAMARASLEQSRLAEESQFLFGLAVIQDHDCSGRLKSIDRLKRTQTASRSRRS